MGATETMLEAVASAKREAKKAEDLWDANDRKVQSLSRQFINIMNGDASRRLIEIATAIRKGNDDLYATKQMLVLMLDKQCRPYLEQNPSAIAIKSVADYLKVLNDESEIPVNVSGSLNGAGLGDIVNVKYIASIECRMVEKFWATTYSTLPEVIEKEKKLRDQKEQAKLTARRNSEKDKIDYLAAMERWKEDAAKAKEKQDAIVAERVAKAKLEEEKKFTGSYHEDVAILQNEIAKLNEQKSQAAAVYAGLGFFKVSEKKAQKKIIEDCLAHIHSDEEKLQAIESEYQGKKSQFEKTIQRREEEIRNQVKREVPIPTEPRRPNTMPKVPINTSSPNYRYQQAIIESLNQGCGYSVAEIMDMVPELSGMSEQRVTSILRIMVCDGNMEREEIKSTAYFTKL